MFKYAKQVFNYLRHTKHHWLVLGNVTDSSFVAFADANFAPIEYCKSQSGGVFQFCWQHNQLVLKKQKTVFISTTKAEYTALSIAPKETLWLQQLLSELAVKVSYPTTIFENNQPVIAKTTNNKNPFFDQTHRHQITRHLRLLSQKSGSGHSHSFKRATC